MAVFFDKLDVLKKGIADVRTSMDQIKVLKREAEQATAPEQEKRRTSQLFNANLQVIAVVDRC